MIFMLLVIASPDLVWRSYIITKMKSFNRHLIETTKRPLNSYYAEWLSGMGFNHFITLTSQNTLTFRSSRGIMSAYHRFINRYDSIDLFYVLEAFEVKDGYHVHSLAKSSLNQSQLFEASKLEWGRAVKSKNIRIDVQKIMTDGVLDYCSKYLLKRHSDYELLLSREATIKQHELLI